MEEKGEKSKSERNDGFGDGCSNYPSPCCNAVDR